MLLDEAGYLIPRAHGRRHDEETTTAWYLFSRADVDEFGIDPSDDDAAFELTGMARFYRGAGRAFGSEPTIRASKTRVLVKQFRGLDI